MRNCEHLCKGCIAMLKENWNYTANQIQVVEVSQKQCDNTFDKDGVMNLNKIKHYRKGLPVQTITKIKEK